MTYTNGWASSSRLPPANKIGAVKAYRGEDNVDLATASRFIESL